MFFGILSVFACLTWILTGTISRPGALEWVLDSPSHHRVHLGTNDKYLDKNLAGVLIIWDRLLGTFQVEEETSRYGLKRDFNSQNPIHIWFSKLLQLYRDLCDAKTPKEAFMRLFGRPDWEPK